MFARLLGIPGISVEKVAEQLGTPSLHIFDANHQSAWAAGHVPGAQNVDPGEFTQSNLPDNPDATVVFYCGGQFCPMASGAAVRARKMGYTNVFVMTEGIAGWIEKGQPVET